jgi:two-component system sensor histidine kinase AlgZ
MDRVSALFGRWLAPPMSPWRIILTAIIPFWIYLTFYDIVIYESYVLGGAARETIALPTQRALQHLLLLPVVLLGYRLAWRIGWPERDRFVAFLWHLLIALVCAGLARLALTAVLEGHGWLVEMGWLADPFPGAGKTDAWSAAIEGEMRGYLLYWLVFAPALWLRATTEFFFVYWFGMALIVSLHTYLELRDEKLSASRLREEWLKARLDSLAGQLNPHFLFNSLNTVSSFVRGDPDRAETILADLSQLLRTSLRERARPFVSVADELEFTERYLAIERTRFEDRLQVRIHAEAEVLSARMPSLLLQPLVENAIKHGVSRSRGPARIEVAVQRAGSELAVLVENTFRPQEGNPNPGESVGIGNVRERLATLYGTRHSFANGVQGELWRVEIRFPFEQESEVRA